MNENTSRRQVLGAVSSASMIAGVVAATAITGRAATVTQSLTTAINNFVPGVGGFVGTLTVTGFNVVNNVLTAAANLSGTVLGPTGAAVGTISNLAVTAPAQV